MNHATRSKRGRSQRKTSATKSYKTINFSALNVLRLASDNSKLTTPDRRLKGLLFHSYFTRCHSTAEETGFHSDLRARPIVHGFCTGVFEKNGAGSLYQDLVHTRALPKSLQLVSFSCLQEKNCQIDSGVFPMARVKSTPVSRTYSMCHLKSKGLNVLANAALGNKYPDADDFGDDEAPPITTAFPPRKGSRHSPLVSYVPNQRRRQNYPYPIDPYSPVQTMRTSSGRTQDHPSGENARQSSARVNTMRRLSNNRPAFPFQPPKRIVTTHLPDPDLPSTRRDRSARHRHPQTESHTSEKSRRITGPI